MILLYLFWIAFISFCIRLYNRSSPSTSKKAAVFHLDLGIGGAEQLMVHLASSLVKNMFDVTVYTAHYDSSRCFPETLDGRFKVKVYGNIFPRTIFGRFHALCAIIRMMICSFCVYLSGESFDWSFNDQVPIINPLLRLFSKKVFFYCHYPDKLLCTDRSYLLKRIYRIPLDYFEELTTSMANVVTVNSNFTKGVVEKHFPSISSRSISVLYPPVDIARASLFSDFDLRETISTQGKESANELLEKLFPKVKGSEIQSSDLKRPFLISLNRYERKKNVNMALLAFSNLPSSFSNYILVIAGGYDDRVAENVEHYGELVDMAEKLNISARVCFLRSINDQLRWVLLKNAEALLYTPPGEHFGMVPCEAMAVGTPVVASGSPGGPRESVLPVIQENNEVDKGTGWLCLSDDTTGWKEGIEMVCSNYKISSEDCRERVQKLFGLEAFARELQRLMNDEKKNA